MTPPGRSSDDDSSPHGEPAPGPSRSGPPGTTPDDSPGDSPDDAPGSDPQLRAMRAVWLEMRDEDPPDRGLAALLAAARHQAAAMQPRPSAWQRLLAALRRPPVLALATVTVLIAGAVLIGRRIPRTASPGLTATQDEAAVPRSIPLDHLTSRTEQAGGPGGALAVPAPQPAPPPPATAAPPPPAAVPPPDRDHAPPPPPAQHATTPSTSMSTAKLPPAAAPRDDIDRASAGPVPAAPAPEPVPAPSERVTRLGAAAALPGDGPSGANNARTANAARPARAELQTQPSGGASNDTANSAANRTANKAASPVANGAASPVTNGVANPVANGVAPARRPPPASPRPGAATDPYRQCEAAAGRGDCATVRRLVDQITRTDPGYPARVAKDSPVGKCLAE